MVNGVMNAIRRKKNKVQYTAPWMAIRRKKNKVQYTAPWMAIRRKKNKLQYTAPSMAIRRKKNKLQHTAPWMAAHKSAAICRSSPSDCLSGRRTEGFVWEFHPIRGDNLQGTMLEAEHSFIKGCILYNQT
jgi:hypothetical protein